MASNQDEDFGLNAYLDIQAELGQWGDSTPVSSPRKYSPRLSRYYDETPAPEATTHGASTMGRRTGGDGDDGIEKEDLFSPSTSRYPNLGATTRDLGGVQTPATMANELIDETVDEDDFAKTEQFVGDRLDSYRPYHDVLFAYLQSRDRFSKAVQQDNENSMMQIDGDDSMVGDRDGGSAQAQAAVDEAEMEFLESLASVCLSRGQNISEDISEDGNNWIDASKNEGNFWDLMSALRVGGLSSLFYCVDGQNIPDLTLSNDPSAMVDSAPADVLHACLGGEERKASLPLQRLNAALGWIEACHGRKFEEALNQEYEGNANPLLPPLRRRTMWPGTVAALQQQRRNPSISGAFHPDAPIKFALGSRSSSPVDVASFLKSEDEIDDARLLRACFMLFKAGRVEEAMKLVSDCGQPWRAALWTGGEPLATDGTGNPTRALWKNQARKISKQMSQMVNINASSMVDSTGTRCLYPSLAYEAAIMSLLSDDVDTALRNRVFETWEDGVHAVLCSELGIIVDDVLRSLNSARVEASQESGGHFPYPGTEFDTLDDGSTPQGNDGDLGAALEKLEASPFERIREEGGDPFRNGMTSFLVGQNALKEYIEECAVLSLEAENNDEACFLRFITHLVIYVDTVLPDFCSQLALPSEIDATTDGSIFSLRELLILKYVAYLSSRRDLWSHVALYTSLLSDGNILDTFSSFLTHVHNEGERQMMLKQARDLFPEGLDCYILRNVVRGMIMSDKDDWARESGEEASLPGVSPADARMMRAVYWLCYYPEHRPDALVCANMLLRKFLLSTASGKSDTFEQDLYAPKVFIDKVLPEDLINMAVDQSQKKDEEAISENIDLPLAQNLEAEYLSIEIYLKAHTKYVQFLDALAKTSPCHKSNQLVNCTQYKHDIEIADKMERNAFRQKKMGFCKIMIDYASRASDALMEVLTFAGGWLVDANSNLDNQGSDLEEAEARSEEMKAMRLAYVPRAVFMLHEVLDKTAMWLEQIAFDTLIQFGIASKDMLLTLFFSFEEIPRSNDDLSMDLLITSQAAPGFWHKKALSLASIVANDGNSLHETFDNAEMEKFLKSVADSYIKLQQSISFFDSIGS